MQCAQCRIEVFAGQRSCPECGGTHLIGSTPGDSPQKITRSDVDSEREGGFRVYSSTHLAGSFPITTGNFIPKKEIDSIVGLVFTSSNRRMGLTVTNLASNTFKDAIQDLELKAKRMGADGVISLLVDIERAGPSAVNFSQTITLTGTAVKFSNQK